ncbi:hypothetical protein KC19_VG340200 [Ceratodon purpureus]|uniref:Uncharacterized protein n=1 Tax=Ceratodon purpureus TaxID=3225 RepID=A0A8T0HXH5_CERPU|nr:hypothetical protein KC19_VG340200 [Ceratodon purpureus]
MWFWPVFAASVALTSSIPPTTQYTCRGPLPEIQIRFAPLQMHDSLGISLSVV